LFWQAQLEKEALEDSHYREQLEQEKRDHELALRLAQETNDQLEEMSLQDNRRYVHTFHVMVLKWIESKYVITAVYM
jgi:myosin-6